MKKGEIYFGRNLGIYQLLLVNLTTIQDIINFLDQKEQKIQIQR